MGVYGLHQSRAPHAQGRFYLFQARKLTEIETSDSAKDALGSFAALVRGGMQYQGRIDAACRLGSLSCCGRDLSPAFLVRPKAVLKSNGCRSQSGSLSSYEVRKRRHRTSTSVRS
jgi:hypothetical protein